MTRRREAREAAAKADREQAAAVADEHSEMRTRQVLGAITGLEQAIGELADVTRAVLTANRAPTAAAGEKRRPAAARAAPAKAAPKEKA